MTTRFGIVSRFSGTVFFYRGGDPTWTKQIDSARTFKSMESAKMWLDANYSRNSICGVKEKSWTRPTAADIDLCANHMAKVRDSGNRVMLSRHRYT